MNKLLIVRSSFQAIHCYYRPISITINKMSTSVSNPIETSIRAALTTNLNPVHMEVINESYMHNVPKGSESHFKVLVVSTKFDGLPLIKRHRMINECVKNELKDKFPHALSIEAKTPVQWDENYKVDASPSCRGGFGK